MARRARVVNTIERPIEDETDNDSVEVVTEETSDNGATETPSSAFSVVDKRGDDYVPPPSDAFGNIEVVEGQPKRRGRKPGTRVAKATASDVAGAAPLLVGLTNQVVVAWVGPECAMAETEAKFLTPSVARVLARLPAGAAQQVSLYTDPLIILTALGLWAARIAKIKEMQAKQKFQVTPFEAARAYGESGTNIGETVEPEGIPIMPTETIKVDEQRANGQTTEIWRGRNPV